MMSDETVPFADISFQWHEISNSVREEFDTVFEKSAFCLGPFVERFESNAADYLGTKHAVGVNSGTSALHLAMLGCALQPNDEVLVPACTFIATIWGVVYAGLRPVFCDVDARTGTIDVDDAAHRVSGRTKAIIPVHLYGQPADMDRVLRFAEDHDLIVVEDAAQAIGARWRGRQVGTFGRFGCFSFYPGKNLGAAGEAGLVVTDDAALTERLKALRNHGQTERYVHEEIGFNYRMDGLQAVVLDHKLRRLDAWTARRRQLAGKYREALADLPVALPDVVNEDHVWHLFVIRTPDRDALCAYLDDNNITTGLHYPVPCHRQPCLQNVVAEGAAFPESDRWADHSLSLPLYYGMTDAQHEHVCAAMRRFFD